MAGVGGKRAKGEVTFFKYFVVLCFILNIFVVFCGFVVPIFKYFVVLLLSICAFF